MTISSIEGVVAAPVLPMHEDGGIDWASLESYIGTVAAGRPAAIAMNMDASEVHALTREEQVEVIRVCRAAVGPDCPLLSGLIAGSTREAVEWAAKLAAAGADGLTLFPVFPHFVGDNLDVGMVHRYFKAVADAAEGAAITGFRMRTMADWSYDLLSALASIDRFLGFKDSTNQLPEIGRTLDAVRRLDRKIMVLTGNDPLILEVMLLGCDGAFIGFAGTLTGELVDMAHRVQRRDFDGATAIWDVVGPLARFCWRAPLRDYRARMKALLVMEGRIRCAALRAPSMGVSAVERDMLRSLGERAGLLPH